MNAATFWAIAAELPVVDVSVVAPGRALVLAPHPDDESLGCGGLIAEACARGAPPLVVVVTDGVKSHPNSIAYPAARLRAVRREETIRAVACLGLAPEHVVFLDYPDTQAPTQGADLQAAAARLAALIRHHGCETILAPWLHDPHCDHEAAHRIAALAARQAGILHRAYPVWGLTLPPDHPLDAAPMGVRLDIGRHRAAKRQAILAHASQQAGLIDDDPEGFQMPAAFIALFDSETELYLDVAS